MIFEARSGTYALVLFAAQPTKILVGALGYLRVQPGFYIYAGSTFGPGGLRARLGHHLRLAARPHWHIDYLRAQAEVQEVWLAYEDHKREHEWASILLSLPAAQIPLPGFGSSDCRCLAHLIYFAEKPSFQSFQKAAPASAQVLPAYVEGNNH